MSDTLIPLAYREITSFSMEKPTTLVFGNNYGLEFTATVMENRYDRFTVFSLDFLGVAAVRGNYRCYDRKPNSSHNPDAHPSHLQAFSPIPARVVVSETC